MSKSKPKSYALVLTYRHDTGFTIYCSMGFYERYFDLIERIDPSHQRPQTVRMHEEPTLMEVRFSCNPTLAKTLHQWFNAIPTEPAEEHLNLEKYV